MTAVILSIIVSCVVFLIIFAILYESTKEETTVVSEIPMKTYIVKWKDEGENTRISHIKALDRFDARLKTVREENIPFESIFSVV